MYYLDYDYSSISMVAFCIEEYYQEPLLLLLLLLYLSINDTSRYLTHQSNKQHTVKSDHQ
jgi:hypothetical protein